MVVDMVNFFGIFAFKLVFEQMAAHQNGGLAHLPSGRTAWPIGGQRQNFDQKYGQFAEELTYSPDGTPHTARKTVASHGINHCIKTKPENETGH
jgi:hypothetical protein